MGNVELRVLGPVRVGTDDGESGLAGAKQRLLAALLAAGSDHRVGTDTLTEAMWPDAAHEDPGHALHNHVSRLRAALGGAGTIERVADGYRLVGAHVGVDADRFQELVDDASRALTEGRAEHAMDLLSRSEAMWRGAPFADVADHSAFTAEIARLEQLRRRATDLRFDAGLSAGRHAELVEELASLVTDDPLDERRRGQLMIALARSGRQAEALAAYQDAVRVLQEQVGVDPGQALRDLHVQLLRQAAPLAAPSVEPPRRPLVGQGETGSVTPALPAPLVAASRQPLVGRETEVERLVRSWEQARSGQGRCVMLEGEPGAGKTRLLAAVADHVLDDGGSVLFGRCDDGLRSPYQPFREALEPREPAGAPSPFAALSGADHPERSRRELFDGVVARIEHLCAQGPTALLIDDLHWGTAPSLLLAAHLVRWTASLPLLIVTTVRDRGYEPDSAARPLLADLRGEPAVDRLLVPGLDLASVRALAGPGEPDEHVAEVHARTGGNAFFVTELLRDAGSPAHDDFGAREGAVPHRVQALIQARRARLPRAADRLLEAGAIVGEIFDAEVAGAAAGLSQQELVEAVDRGVAAGMLKLNAAGSNRYAFVHALVRETVLAQLSPIRARALHAAVAHSIRTAHPHDEEEVAAELAHHFVEAGEADLGLRYAVLAGDVAHRSYAWEDAAALYRRALKVCDRADQATRRPELLLAVADAERRAGDSAAALDSYRAAHQAAHETGSAQELAQAALGFEDTRLEETFEEHADASLAMLEQALEAVGDSGDVLATALMARVVVARSHIQGLSPQLQQLAEEVVQRARRSADPSLHVTALEASYWVHWSAPGLAHRLVLTEKMAELRPSLDDRRVLRARVLGASASLEFGRRDTFERELEAYRADAERVPEPWYRWWIRAFDGSRALLDGRLEDVEQVVADLAPEARVRQQQEVIGLFTTVHVIDRGIREQVPLLIQGWEALISHGGILPSMAHAGLAYLNVLSSDEDTARRHLEQASPDELISWPSATWALGFLGLAAAELDNRPVLQAVHELLAPHPRRVLMLGVLCPYLTTSLVLARVADGLGDLPVALEHAEQATELHDQLGARSWGARSRYHLAEMLLRRDEPDDAERARRLAEAALGTARELGLRDLAAQVKRLPG